MPIDSKHLKELRELDKRGLTKLIFTGSRYKFIVHKNVPNKISRDFIEREQDIVVFIDRNEDKPAKCHLYKSSCPMPSIYIQADDIIEELKEEADDLKDCTVLILKNET